MHPPKFPSCGEDEVKMDLKRAEERGKGQEIRLGGAQFLLRKSLGSLIWKAIVAGVNHPRPRNEENYHEWKTFLGEKVGYQINPALVVYIKIENFRFQNI